MQDNYLARNSDPLNQDYDHLSDFKYILANQHSKQFHLIDSPDLIFQLSQYKYLPTKSPKPINQSQPSFNKKIYRHKSQQETIESDNFLKTSLNKNSPLSHQKFKNTRFQLKQNVITTTQNKPTKKIQFRTKQKSYTSKEKSRQTPLKIDFKNLTQKQNLHAKILSVSRPLTSKFNDCKNLPLNESQIKSNWKKGFQRKKYSDLKGKLQNMIKTVQNCEDLNFSQVFEYQQAILKQYLESLVCQLKKECIQKGQLMEIIWNTFFALINKIMKMLIQRTKSSQKSQIQAEINLHEGYQQMYVYEANKIIQLGKKYNESKNVIDRLIYELRFKRKESKRLYKSLAICNEKLNEYKVEHIDLQNQHIDLLIEARQMNQDEAVQILKRKLEVNKEKYMKLRVGMNKQKMKQTIEEELLSERLDPEEQQDFKKQLCDKINSFKLKKKISPSQQKQQNQFLEQFIQRYSSKFIYPQKKKEQVQITKTIRKPQKISIAVNTDADPKSKPQFTYSVTQTTYSDKLQYCLINHHSTQTPGFQKMKKVNNVEIQADGDQMKIILTKAKMMAYKTMDLSFYFEVKKTDKIKHILSNRTSQLSAKKSQFLNGSISQIESDDNDSIPIVSSKKRLSKNQLTVKRDKKLSIFNNSLPNYSNLRPNQFQNVKNESKSKIHKKRASEMPEAFQMGFQESEYKKRHSRAKKRTFQTPDAFRLSPNRQSICSSNVESLIENLSINEQKERYIQSFLMNKDQQFEIVEQRSLFDAFRSYINERQNRKQSNFLHKNQKEPDHQKIPLKRRQERASEQGSEDFEILNPKESLISFSKFKQTHRQRNIRNNHSIQTASFNKIKEKTERKAQKQTLKKAHFLQMIIEYTVKKSLIKKKVDQSNFQACKQKSQFISITQKLDPFMLDVECLMNRAFVKKKKNSSINIKAANKLLMMTYSRSIDKITRNSAILENLIRPLFECFEVIYGAMKPNDIYRKMVGFISDIMSVKESENFKEFIFFLGMDKSNINSAHLTTFDVCLYLKLLEKLNLGGKICSQSETVFTSRKKVESQLVIILDSQNISPEVIMTVSGKIKGLLEKLQDFVRERMSSSDQETKINLFKVSKMIVEEIIKMRAQSMKKLEMYMTGTQKIIETMQNIQIAKNDWINVKLIRKIVECCRISTTKKLYFSKYIEELCAKDNKQSGQKIIKRSELGVLLIRIGLVNFDQLEERIKFINQRDKRTAHDQGVEDQQKGNQMNYNQFGKNLQKLSCVQVQTNNVLENILGNMMIAYEIGLIKNLENKKDKPK